MALNLLHLQKILSHREQSTKFPFFNKQVPNQPSLLKSFFLQLQELRCESDKRLSDLEAELAKERMEKEALIATEVCVDRGGGCGHDKATAGAEVEVLRARLTERDAEVARLEVLSQERAQLVEKRATELADLHVCGRGFEAYSLWVD